MVACRLKSGLGACGRPSLARDGGGFVCLLIGRGAALARKRGNAPDPGRVDERPGRARKVVAGVAREPAEWRIRLETRVSRSGRKRRWPGLSPKNINRFG